MKKMKLILNLFISLMLFNVNFANASTKHSQQGICLPSNVQNKIQRGLVPIIHHLDSLQFINEISQHSNVEELKVILSLNGEKSYSIKDLITPKRSKKITSIDIFKGTQINSSNKFHLDLIGNSAFYLPKIEIELSHSISELIQIDSNGQPYTSKVKLNVYDPSTAKLTHSFEFNCTTFLLHTEY